MRRLIIGSIALFSVLDLFGQTGVGIGTANPNPNAVLDIVSTSSDKGVLIPRLTTSQRNNMATNLAAGETGLLVFDDDLKTFFFWSGTAWTTINIVQDLQLIGNTLTITNNLAATNIDLAPFAGTNTDNQILTLTGTGLDISGGNSVDLSVLQDGVTDADADPTNELQTLNKTGNTVALSNGGGSFTDAVNDADADPTNELQNISTSGAAGNISLTGGATLSLNVNDADANAANELQTISKTGSTVSLSNGGGSFTDEFNDADASPTNELQTISKAGSTVSLSGSGGSFTDEVNDADNNPTNEIQLISKTGSTVTLSNGGGSFTDDSGTDDQQINLAGTTLSIESGNSVDLSIIQDGVNDADANPANELQTISKAGSTVTLSNGGGSFTDEVNDADANSANELQTISKAGSTVTLSDGGGSFTDDSGTDDQRLNLTGTTLTIEDGNNVDLSVIQDGVNDADADPANEIQNLSSTTAGTNRTINITGGTGTTFSVADNDNSAANEIQDISSTGAAGNITLSSGSTLNLNVNDADASATNEIQNLSSSTAGTNRTINITGGTGTTISVADNDNSASNEIQNLSAIPVGTNRTINISGGTGTTFSVADNDNSTSNEIQTLSVAGSNLTISGGNTVAIPTYTPFNDAFNAFYSSDAGISAGKNPLIFDVKDFDFNGSYDEASGVFKAPVEGIYLFTGMVTVRQDGGTPYDLEINVEGARRYRKRFFPPTGSNGFEQGLEFNFEVYLFGGEGVEFFITMPASNATITGAQDLSFISGRLVLER